MFNPADSESAHDRLPLVRDPTLVHAAQLDILKLQNYATENIQSRVQQIVHAFGSIEKDFKASLRADSCRNVRFSRFPKNIFNFTIRYINNSLPTRKKHGEMGSVIIG